jgi:hypothetical protein
MIAISTTYFYTLMCIFIAVPDTFATLENELEFFNYARPVDCEGMASGDAPSTTPFRFIRAAIPQHRLGPIPISFGELHARSGAPKEP